MYQNLFAIGWAMHVVDDFAKGWVPIKNPNQYNLLNSSPTKNIWYDLVRKHAQCYELGIRVQTSWVLFRNKIRQT
jgi:hypothetical protein